MRRFALLAVFALAGLLPVRGAPVPPAPRLTDELLVGCWRYEYGGAWARQDPWVGHVAFHKDGTYCAWSSDPGEPFYVGRWSVEGNTVYLVEQKFWIERGDLSSPHAYSVTLSTAKYPRLEGTSPRARYVILSEPER